ncbi:MAG: KdsC family phosphatase [Myxococcaceae bacterium]
MGAEEVLQRAAEVRLLVLDVDGVMTDGGLYFGTGGELFKRFDAKDGFGLVLAREAGLPFALLSGRTSPAAEARGADLGAVTIVQGVREKLPAFESLLRQQGVPESACAYMGDDLIDLPVLEVVGLPACPADAVPQVRARCAFVSQSPGGRGAIRELVDLCLKARAAR